MLIAAKFVAWIGTGSVALLSSLVNSTVDAAASLVIFVAVRQAALPPDREHRFGHGKAEPLAALGQAAFLLGSALFLIAEAVRRLISPEPIENTEIGVAVMLFSLIVTIGLVAYQRHVVRRTGSLAINADALHYSSDILMNFERHRDAADPIRARGADHRPAVRRRGRRVHHLRRRQDRPPRR